MTNLAKTRTIIFRVTEREYERLKTACLEAGSRTLSDYTRSELLKALDTDSQGFTVPERFEFIDQKLGDLKDAVNRVATRLAPGDPVPEMDPEDKP